MRALFRFSGLVVLLSAAALIGCSQKPSISGEIKDNFGHPLQGVTIEIANSAFSDTTNSDGDYKIDYAPGSFVLSMSKAGYTSKQITLNLTTNTQYPMNEIVLTKIPPTGGVYLLGKDDYVALANGWVNSTSSSAGFMEERHEYQLARVDTSQIAVVQKELARLPDNNVVIFDTYPQQLMSVLVFNARIGYIQSNPLSFKSDIRTIKETAARADGLLSRTLTLKPSGLSELTKNAEMCYVEVYNALGASGFLIKNSSAFCLKG